MRKELSELELYFNFSSISDSGYRTSLCNKIMNSDFLISDDKCVHRLIGLHYTRGGVYAPIITVVCTRAEMSFAKRLSFNVGKIIYNNSGISANLFKKYPVGAEIQPEDFYNIVPFYANYYKRKGIGLCENLSVNS